MKCSHKDDFSPLLIHVLLFLIAALIQLQIKFGADTRISWSHEKTTYHNVSKIQSLVDYNNVISNFNNHMLTQMHSTDPHLTERHVKNTILFSLLL